MKHQLDAKDQAILEILQQDSTISVKEIGERVGLSFTPTYERIKNLEHLQQDLTHLKLQCSQHKTIEQCGILKELHQPLECEHESYQHKKAPPL